jgi:hypothetical protein
MSGSKVYSPPTIEYLGEVVEGPGGALCFATLAVLLARHTVGDDVDPVSIHAGVWPVQQSQQGIEQILRWLPAIVAGVAVGILALVQKLRPFFATREAFDDLKKSMVHREEFAALERDVREVKVAQDRAINAMEALGQQLTKVVAEAESMRRTGADVREVREIVETIRREQAATISRLSTILEHQVSEVAKLRDVRHGMQQDITALKLKMKIDEDELPRRRRP